MPKRAPTHRPNSARFKTIAKAAPAQRRLSPSKRGYDGAWRKIRTAFLSAHPLCRHCEAAGVTTPAREVDHIRPLADGGTNAWTNLQPLCKSHHSQKTYGENIGKPKTHALR